MAVNLATKYSSVVDEIMKLGALSNAAINSNYDFVGAQTVKVYSFDTSDMNDYTRSGSNRYGTAAELQDNLQEMTMSQAKSFTFTIDNLNAIDSPEGLRNAGARLSAQINERVIPMLDTYRFVRIAAGAGTTRTDYTAITSSNAYTKFLAANTAISETEAPLDGRIAFCTPTFVQYLKLDTNFVKASDMAQGDIIYKGQVGQVDGVTIIQVPYNRMPSGSSFIITHPAACTAPVKLSEYKIHTDAPGISGSLVEGLVYHDAFVLNNKKNFVRVQMGVLGALTVAGVAGASGTSVLTKSLGNSNGVTKYYYKLATSAITPPALGDAVPSGYTEIPADGIVTPAGSTYTHCVAIAVDANSKVVATSADTTIAIAA